MKILTIPNLLTFLRICGLPWLWALLWQHQFASALAVFTLLALTDFLDGFLARAFAWQSRFGAMLDPIADKLFVCGTLVVCNMSCIYVPFISVHESFTLLTSLMWLLIIKEIVFVAVAGLLLYTQMPLLAVSIFAKWLTALESIFLGYLLVVQFASFLFFSEVILALYYAVCGLLTVVCLQYGVQLYRQYRQYYLLKD